MSAAEPEPAIAEPSAPSPGDQEGGGGEEKLDQTIRERSRDLGWTLFGKLAMTGANSGLMLLLGWLMDVKLFGLFTTAVGAQLLASRMVLLGVDQGMIRLYTVDRYQDQPYQVIMAGLRSALVLSVPVLLIGAIAILVGVEGWPGYTILSVMAGSVGLALFDFGVCSRLSELRFRAAAVVQASMPGIRLLLTTGAFLVTPDHPGPTFLCYALCALGFGIYLSFRTIRKGRTWPAWTLVREVVRYSKWPGASDVAMMLCLQQGLFLLTYLKKEEDRGVYGFALTLGMGFFAIFLAYYQTILPRASRLKSVRQLPRFIARTMFAGFLLALACVPIAALIGWILPMILVGVDKPELLPFPRAFYALAGFMLLLIIEAPLTVACQYLLRPQLALIGLLIRVAVVLAIGMLLVPERGAYGAGIAQLLGGVCSFVILFVMVMLTIRSRLSDLSDAPDETEMKEQPCAE